MGERRWHGGLGYRHVLPYFKRLENRLIGGDAYRGEEGPLKLTTPACDNPLFEAFFQAVQDAGYPLTDDVNGAQQEGFGRFDRTTFEAPLQCSARLPSPRLSRPNLEIQTGVMVERILFEGQRAVGVQVEEDAVAK